MKNQVKKSGQWYSNVFLVLLLPIISGSTNPPVSQATCPGSQIFAISQPDGSASFSWNAVSGASGYVVYYIRQNDNYTSPQTHTSNTSITYSGLPSGRYIFYIATDWGSTLSEFIIVEDLII